MLPNAGKDITQAIFGAIDLQWVQHYFKQWVNIKDKNKEKNSHNILSISSLHSTIFVYVLCCRKMTLSSLPIQKNGKMVMLTVLMSTINMLMSFPVLISKIKQSGQWESFPFQCFTPLDLYSLRRRRLTGIGIPIINLRRSDDRLRFIMGIPMLIRPSLLSE